MNAYHIVYSVLLDTGKWSYGEYLAVGLDNLDARVRFQVFVAGLRSDRAVVIHSVTEIASCAKL